ncbi:unnamed protein product [Caenorhabditis angaria]|uniref:Uncharacterized protein n=1 Tax=Caenorhabditis angaria TaxID=860376 RepID=A0A9P1IZA1_9PELO|nr:unnamed protein product [Caenorhabditis angaria]
MSQSFVFIFVALVASVLAQSSSSSGNIYGYNYDSNALASGPFLVQNPNYQFLNDQLANEYAQSYQEELRQYDSSVGITGSGTSSGSGSGSVSGSGSTSYNNQIPVSQTYVPVNGYYYGPVMTNAQQNTLNYQQITQKNPSTSASSSTNIYGYNTGSSGSSSSSSTYNNQQMYSAPSTSTATPYIYPFGQYASSSASSTNQVLRDSSSTSGSSSSSTGSNSDVGRTYSLFYNDQTATPAYQSQSDLKTTTLRDQALPSNVNLRGTGPLPGPTLGSSNTLTQQFNDAGSNAYYYSGNANLNSNSGSARVKKASRFFDVAGNQTEMYYPYRTSTNYNTANTNSATGTGSSNSGSTGTFFDSVTAATTTAQKCQLSDPYWCADYVNVYVSSKRTYTSESTQTICSELVASLAESYNGCCTAVRSAGCSM